jgi:histidinol-phosphate aminotransferase
MGLEPIPSEANFVFANFSSAEAASEVFDKLTERGIYVRYFTQDGLDRGLRISIGTDEEMDRLLEELETLV